MSEKSASRIDDAGVGSIAGNALGDQPTPFDNLGFTPYVDAIARFLSAKATRPPLSISIEGDWGSGKSSFLLQLENAIGGVSVKAPLIAGLPVWLGGIGSTTNGTRERMALTVRFNAWRHDKQDAVWAAFALAFVRSLRAKVGIARAWRGDIHLFVNRLKGFRAWLELFLLMISLAAIVFGIINLCIFISTHPGDARRILDWLLRGGSASTSGVEASPQIGFGDALRHVASYGTFGTIAAIGAAGLYKFHTYIRMPLSWKLEKYISKPNYEGHASFIENFHIDLNRLVKAYAGTRRVFIFIDDLDRCDVPRAADLMQAINLMIGDSKNLVFIIGMDREKVAAGIAQKYKDILPFLRESANWKPNDEKDNYTPLYFGYGYLEKFIQISFSLPIASDEAALDAFLQEEDESLTQQSWLERLLKYWTKRFGVGNSPISNQSGETPAPPPEDVSVQAVQKSKRVFNRLKVERDSESICKIVKIVSVVFEYNPRRIKQFINTFRLALYIASDQGLFDDVDGGGPSATIEQIGKCIALLLRFPDLRFALEQDSKLLGKLEEMALKPPEDRIFPYHWMGRTGTIRVLQYGCNADQTDSKYSLKDFDASRLFSVLPSAAKPSEYSDPAIVVFESLADRYEKIRKSEAGGQARTRKMTTLAEDALEAAARLASPEQTLGLLASSKGPGVRLMRILIALVHKDRANLSWLKDYNRSFISPFEHYWCIRTLLEYVPLMTDADRGEINQDLEARWKEIETDSGRAMSADHLRDLTRYNPPKFAA